MTPEDTRAGACEAWGAADPWGYLAGCRLADGGYFFARVAPSSPRDTYFALACFCLAGRQPPGREATVRFLLDRYRQEPPASIYGLFFIVEGLALLGYPVSEEFAACAKHIYRMEGPDGGFGLARTLDIAVPSELETTFLAIRLLSTLRQPFDVIRTYGFVVARRNADGGFGGGGFSNLATTYYALATLAFLNRQLEDPASTIHYLRQVERFGSLLFVEQAYWLVSALNHLQAKPERPARIAAFIEACRRSSGGFGRAAAIGIPTIENTYYALATLNGLGLLPSLSGCAPGIQPASR
ncbi:MAG: prenyltransferase/squalene oxidase repeat-containing protein [Desulfotomaculales bacterium]